MTLRNALGAVALGILVTSYVVIVPNLGLTGAPVVDMQTIRNQVAVDAVAEYRIAKAHSTAMDTCAAAGLVTAGYLEAQNTAEYQYWKGIEKADCTKAGVAGDVHPEGEE